jgi:hypothetical protein
MQEPANCQASHPQHGWRNNSRSQCACIGQHWTLLRTAAESGRCLLHVHVNIEQHGCNR